MSKSKYTAEWKIEIVKKYLSGEGSYDRLVRFKFGHGKSPFLNNGKRAAAYFAAALLPNSKDRLDWIC